MMIFLRSTCQCWYNIEYFIFFNIFGKDNYGVKASSNILAKQTMSFSLSATKGSKPAVAFSTSPLNCDLGSVKLSNQTWANLQRALQSV